MLTATLLGFLAALVATLLATPVVRALALGRNLLDAPNHRKVHTEAVPRLGGIALGAGILLGTVGAVLLSAEARDILLRHGTRFATLVAAAGLLALVGLYDDVRGLSARAKLLAQVGAGVIAFTGGNALTLFGGGVVGPPVALALNLAATVLWIVAITNAMNLIDGLDGLATGITTIVVLALAALAAAQGRPGPAFVAAVVAGAAIGFLPYNLHPARIFLGDSGSFLLGSILAVLSIQALREGSPWSSAVLLLFLFGVPLLDVTLAIVRRLLRGHAVMTADGNHIHHRLLRRGLGHRQSVLILWATTLLFGLLATGLALYGDGAAAGPLRLGIFLLLLAAARALGALEVTDLARTLLARERRRQSPRDRNLAVRRALKDIAAWREVEGLDHRLIALARQIDLDLIDIEVALPTEGPARAVPLVQWERPRTAPHDAGVERDDGGPAEPMPIETFAAVVDGPSGLRGTVVLGRERWKLRRQSEEARIWAHLLAEGVGSLDADLAARLASSRRAGRRLAGAAARAVVTEPVLATGEAPQPSGEAP
ncbi:MAG TPA: MraY family glycosyltransferase [Dongiaceae bacterium]|nr:MraY family glycosyltransferase [Dongiaceae bacterium]